MQKNDANTRMCVSFFKALIRGNFACRQVWHHRAHFAANDRTVVFHRHFKLGMVERELRLPPCSDMFVPEVGNKAPVQRCAEEEITFSIPVVQEEIKATVAREFAEVVGDLDRAFLDREAREKNVADDTELDDINVARKAISEADAAAAPEEVAEVARAMDNPRLTSVDVSDDDEEVIQVSGPVTARPRGSVGTSLDQHYMRESGASAKPDPNYRSLPARLLSPSDRTSLLRRCSLDHGQ